MDDRRDALERFARIAFWLAVGLFLYSTLLPFQFDLSERSLARGFARAEIFPFWNPELGRLRSIPDIFGNFLLALPVGFFGLLLGDLRGRPRSPWLWGMAGLILGLAVEVAQLAIPIRTASVTDFLSNGTGALAGALAARLGGARIRRLFHAMVPGSRRNRIPLMLFVLTLSMLGPLDLTLDVGLIRQGVRSLLDDPWESRTPVGDEWVLAAQFAIFGALCGAALRDRRREGREGARIAILAFATPVALEGAQLFTGFHNPSLRDLVFETAGVAAGWAAIRIAGTRPGLPSLGLLALSLSLLAAGLSPYEFVPWQGRSAFGWMPLYEYYVSTGLPAIYDAGFGFLSYALFGALMRVSRRTTLPTTVLAAAALSLAIEVVQTIIPARFPGLTDVGVAALGAWAGGALFARWSE